MTITIKLNVDEFKSIQQLRRRINTNKSLFGNNLDVCQTLKILDKIIDEGLNDDLIKYI